LTPVFKILLTGDYLDKHGQLACGDIGLGLLDGISDVHAGFLLDQKPNGDDPSYRDRLYSLEVQPHHVAEANGLIVCRPWVKGSAFAQGAENLVAIGRAGAGYDKIDLAACTANDVVVFNSPDSLTHSTGSAALLLMLALAKRLREQEQVARTGHWEDQNKVKGDDIIGKTLGIVGLGNTGRELARLAAPFGMRIIAYSPRADRDKAKALGVELTSNLDELLRESDFVSLHCRLEDKTRGMMGEREFRLMKKTAYFINVARGELVQQQILVRCLRERWIAGAGLDVFEHEPLPVNDPLIGMQNVILTPHYLAATIQATRGAVTSVLKGMLQVSQGHLPENILNAEVLQRPGFRAKLSRFAQEPRGEISHRATLPAGDSN
jgi:phosphoglycerate dehydrogenase-like enzyme